MSGHRSALSRPFMLACACMHVVVCAMQLISGPVVSLGSVFRGVPVFLGCRMGQEWGRGGEGDSNAAAAVRVGRARSPASPEQPATRQAPGTTRSPLAALFRLKAGPRQSAQPGPKVLQGYSRARKTIFSTLLLSTALPVQSAISCPTGKSYLGLCFAPYSTHQNHQFRTFSPSLPSGRCPTRREKRWVSRCSSKGTTPQPSPAAAAPRFASRLRGRERAGRELEGIGGN